MKRRPVRDAATEVETLAIEAREILAQLATDGLEVRVDFLGIRDAIQFRIKIPAAAPAAENEVPSES